MGCHSEPRSFLTTEANKTADNIIALRVYDKIKHVTDSRIHFQLVCFCVHTKFQYSLHCVPLQIVLGACAWTMLDKAAVSALLC